ncbi:MAG: tRNA lysidine(34) synthetase TilS [Alphaproteobacteria bacterium]
MAKNMQSDKSSSVLIMDELCSFMDDLPDRCGDYDGNIAVGVSGGPDSMALCYALSRYFSEHQADGCIHALSVDHGLRTESAQEAQMVKVDVSKLSHVIHETLLWRHDGVDGRVQERARAARYDLFSNYMSKHNITHLFLAHHMDDQAETFLFRLAKGSGLDGLSCMLDIQERSDGVSLCRPFLNVEKRELVAYCDENDVPYVHDPSNDADKYARVRLRNSMEALKEEGLTSKRLAMTAKRLSSARSALDQISAASYVDCLVSKDTDRLVFNFKLLLSMHKEVVLRVVGRGISVLCGQQGYGVRLERLENLCDDLMKPQRFRKRTLGGVIFEVRDKDETFLMTLEHSKNAEGKQA